MAWLAVGPCPGLRVSANVIWDVRTCPQQQCEGTERSSQPIRLSVLQRFTFRSGPRKQKAGRTKSQLVKKIEDSSGSEKDQGIQTKRENQTAETQGPQKGVNSGSTFRMFKVAPSYHPLPSPVTPLPALSRVPSCS